MGESMNSTRGFDSEPIPSNVPVKAAARGDIERGHMSTPEDEPYRDREDGDDGEKRKDSMVTSEKGKEKHGRGLTEGDAGEYPGFTDMG